MTETEEYEQFDVITATYLPQKMTDLKPWAALWVGTRMKWKAAWLVDEGTYAGQWAFRPMTAVENDDRDLVLPPFGWAPQCDLVDVVREGGWGE